MTVTNWMRGDILGADDLDAAFGNSVDKRGDTMVGLLTLVRDPIGPLDAATKQYVDNTVLGLVPSNVYVIKAGDTMTGPLVLSGTLTHATKTGAMWGTYLGDTRPWFVNGKWGFGWQAVSTTDSVAGSGVLTVQRNATYVGSSGANPAALAVNSVIGPNVTGGESALAVLVNDSGSSGIHVGTQITCNKLVASAATLFAGNTVAQDQTGRKSSVAGALVTHEFDIIAAGPDDQADRINLDLIGREYPGGSTDGATVHTVAGARVRGQTRRGGAAGVVNTPSTSVYGFRTQTAADIGGAGQMMAFQNAFACDAASNAGFSAVSAVQTLQTNAAFVGGVTTLTLATTNDKLCNYVWPGCLVTGTGIAANTHVVTESYDNNVTITITIDIPTSGAIANGATLTFTNQINNAFTASGYLTGNVFSSPGFSVNTVGRIAPLLTNAANDAAAAAAGVAIGQMYRNANAVQVRLV